MRKRPEKQEVKEILTLKEETFKLRLDMAKKRKSPPIHMEELEKVLKALKVGRVEIQKTGLQIYSKKE